ncbi:MAG: hypothetical protein ACYTKD_30060 [Planctomycetota bacterium]
MLNACADRLQPQDASERWVRDGAADPEVRPDTTRRVADLRWGEKRVVPTPGDRDGLERAIAAGCHVVAPSEMSAAEWDRMREADAVPSTSASAMIQYWPSSNEPSGDATVCVPGPGGKSGPVPPDSGTTPGDGCASSGMFR